MSRGMDRRRKAEVLMEVLMSSVNLNKVPVELGWSVWRAFTTNKLTLGDGWKILIKACKYCEPSKTSRVLKGEEI